MTQSQPDAVYRLMESQVDANAAIATVLQLAQRELCLFDISPASLADRQLGRPTPIDILKKLLHADRQNRIRVVLHETQGIESELPRLVALLGLHSAQLQIHRAVGAAREAKDPLLIADDAHFWHKLHVDHPHSVVTLHNATETRPLKERFEQIWEDSEPAVSSSTLGL
ncbi:MAG: hypothetical protein JNM52_07320 [Betaproteobacteria bacterium]|nr:hypothetical protein [Betaproteobacteria bacterium]